jgi:hypothetical protein
MKWLIALGVALSLLVPISLSAHVIEQSPVQKACSERKADLPSWRSSKCVRFIGKMVENLMSGMYGPSVEFKGPVDIKYLTSDESDVVRDMIGEGLLGRTDMDKSKIWILTPTSYFNEPVEMVLAHELTHILQGQNKLPSLLDNNRAEMEARDISAEAFFYLFPPP